MINIKTPEQIEGIRKSCKLAALTLQYLDQFVVPGVTTNYVNDIAEKFIRDNGAVPAPLNYKGFPKATCISVNEVVCHGVPSERILKDGDIVNVDVTTILNGYFGDTCKMFPVGKVSDDAVNLMKTTFGALLQGILQVRPGNQFGNIGWHIQKYAEEKGYSVVFEFCGHGVGLEFHEEPQVSHVARKMNMGPNMQPGMIFTIEPMINQGSPRTILNEQDGWTASTFDGKLSAQYEHTVLVTENGVEVLTNPDRHQQNEVSNMNNPDTFDMLFWRDGNVWRRYWSTLPEQYIRDIGYLRKEHGQNVGILILHHPANCPCPATAYSESGMDDYLKTIQKLKRLD